MRNLAGGWALPTKIGSALVLALFCAWGASAEPSYSITNVPAEVELGTSFTVYVLLDLDGYSSVGHEMSVSFSPGVLFVEEAVELGVPPYQMNIWPGVRDVDNAVGFVEQIEAATFVPIHTEGFE